MIRRKFLLTALSALLLSVTTANTSEKEEDFSIGMVSLPTIATTFENCYLTDCNSLRVVLSDGSQWTILDAEEKNAYDVLSTHWNKEDDIRIFRCKNCSTEDGRFILKNVRTQDVLLVALDKDCSSCAFFIDKIDENGYAIIMNNGMEWVIGWLGSFTTQNWQSGDRVIINKSFYSRQEDYRLINAENSSSCWGSAISWKEREQKE